MPLTKIDNINNNNNNRRLHTYKLARRLHTYKLARRLHTYKLARRLHTYKLARRLHTYKLARRLHTYKLAQMHALKEMYKGILYYIIANCILNVNSFYCHDEIIKLILKYYDKLVL